MEAHTVTGTGARRGRTGRLPQRGVTVTREVDGVPERVVVGPPQPGGSAVTTRVACLGDSLTRAQLSVDYLDLLVRRRPPGDVRLARFGVNGDFAYNLLGRPTPSSRTRPR